MPDNGRKPYPASNLDDAHLLCRDTRHLWHVDGYYQQGTNLKSAIVVRVLRCGRCGTLRHDTMTNNLEDKVTTYIYADNYLIPRGTEFTRPSVGDLRREQVKRLGVQFVQSTDAI